MRIGTIEWKQGEDVYLLLVCHSSFLWASYWLRTAEDPFGYAVKWKLKPQQDPQPSTPALDTLVSMLTGTPHHT